MPSCQIIVGDCLEQLGKLPAGSVQCVVTSPPYWGLRDYGTDGQIGLEKTPEEYVAKMVEVFAAVRRVLRGDGTLWLNLGDSYAVSEYRQRNNQGEFSRPCRKKVAQTGRKPIHGLKPKDLIGIPWRVALALQADGWWLRSDIIWHKPNPMPESVTDRPTKAHEYIFLMTKSATYFYDAEAIREKVATPWDGVRGYREGNIDNNHRPTEYRNDDRERAGRNKRSVWTVPTQGFSEAHFATFPEDLITPCIKAGTSLKGCCPECGKPWVRIIEKDRVATRPGDNNVNDDTGMANRDSQRHVTESKTIGWEAGCECGSGIVEPSAYSHASIPCTVLDPFVGSGTTGVVALRYGCAFIGIELNEEYAGMARRRITNDAPLLNRVIA